MNHEDETPFIITTLTLTMRTRTEHGFTMWSPNTNRTEHREKNSDRTRTEQNTGKEILTEHEQNRTPENNYRANTPNMRVREHACSFIPGPGNVTQ